MRINSSSVGALVEAQKRLPRKFSGRKGGMVAVVADATETCACMMMRFLRALDVRLTN